MDRWTDRRTGGRTHRWMDGHTDGWMGRHTAKQMDRLMGDKPTIRRHRSD